MNRILLSIELFLLILILIFNSLIYFTNLLFLLRGSPTPLVGIFLFPEFVGALAHELALLHVHAQVELLLNTLHGFQGLVHLFLVSQYEHQVICEGQDPVLLYQLLYHSAALQGLIQVHVKQQWGKNTALRYTLVLPVLTILVKTTFSF